MEKCPEPLKKNESFKSDKEVASILWEKYSKNPELKELEIQGFLSGLKRGKTMDVPLRTLFRSLEKQHDDWLVAYVNKNILEMKKALADLRNVAGIMFLKLNEGGDRKE